MKVVLRRFLELLISAMAFSFIVTLLHTRGYIPGSRDVLGLMMLFCTIIFYIYHIYCLSQCFDEMYHRRDYYRYNIIAFSLFGGIVFLSYKILGNTLFTWFFCITKTFVLFIYFMDSYNSMLLFLLIAFVPIMAVPYFKMGKWKKSERKRH